MTPETIPGTLTPVSLINQTVTANVTNLDGVDIRDYKGKLQVVLTAGAATNDDQSAAVKLQHSDEANANFVDFDPAVTFTSIAANGGAALESIALDTRVAKRYVRAHVTAASGDGRPVAVIGTGIKRVTS